MPRHDVACLKPQHGSGAEAAWNQSSKPWPQNRTAFDNLASSRHLVPYDYSKMKDLDSVYVYFQVSRNISQSNFM